MLKGTESYAVKFWIQKPDGFWEQQSKVYYGYYGKSDHRKAEKDWKKEFSKQNVKLVSITYQ